METILAAAEAPDAQTRGPGPGWRRALREVARTALLAALAGWIYDRHV